MMRHIKSLWAPKYLLVLAIIYTFLLTWGSLVSPEVLPKLEKPVSDKVIHFMGYCGLMLIWFFYVYFRSDNMKYKGKLVIIAILAIFYGIIIEVLQESVTASRQAELSDVFANFTGICIAVLLLLAFVPKLKKLKSMN